MLHMCLGSPRSCGVSKPGATVPHHPGGGAHDPQVGEGNGPPRLLPCSAWSKEHLGSNMAQACPSFLPKLLAMLNVFCIAFPNLMYLFSMVLFWPQDLAAAESLRLAAFCHAKSWHKPMPFGKGALHRPRQKPRQRQRKKAAGKAGVIWLSCVQGSIDLESA